MSVFWGPLATKPWDVVGGLVVIGVVAAVNVRGLEQSAGVTAFLGLVDLIAQALLVVLGAVFIFSPGQISQNVHLGAAPSLEQLILACAVAMIAYTGIDTIGEMAGEARDPDRDLPRATTGLLGSVVTLYVALSLIAMMAMPVFMAPLVQANPSHPGLLSGSCPGCRCTCSRTGSGTSSGCWWRSCWSSPRTRPSRACPA